jgi:hypothetical protein
VPPASCRRILGRRSSGAPPDAKGIDTADLPDGRYQLTVLAENTRRHIGSRTITFETENGVPAAPVRTRRVFPGRPRAE